MNLCYADLHIHTHNSFCAPDTTFIESYLPYCEGEGIKILGISDHFYSQKDLGSADTVTERTLRLREEVEAAKKQTCIKLMYGCEAEYFYNRPTALTRELAQHYDYVLFAPSHIFNQKWEYDDAELEHPDSVRKILMREFREVCALDYGVPMGIAHPFYPIRAPWQQDVLDGITDDEYAECFSLAAARGLSIEIHASLTRKTTALDADGISPAYVRMLAIAKECGCKFHFGSDAHKPEAFIGGHAKLELAARRIGITEDDLWEIVR